MQENGNTTIAQMHKNELETAKAMSAVKVGAAGVLAGVGLVLYLGTTLKHLEQDFGLFKQSTETSLKRHTKIAQRTYRFCTRHTKETALVLVLMC